MPEDRIMRALSIAWQYGQIPGEEHKMWVIDQMVKVLAGKRYEEFVRHYESDCDYIWEHGNERSVLDD